MNWTCPAIDHGITIFPDGKIRPCCQTDAEYSKPLSFINNPERFADIKSQNRPPACKKCWEKEDQGQISYRHQFLSLAKTPGKGIRFLDFRHTNQCNLKCRYCNPHFSNQWAKELKYQKILQKSDILKYLTQLITDDLEEIYWCGGEPLIIKDHYNILQKIIALGLSEKISLKYNTNLTSLTYKEVSIIEIWAKFKSVSIMASIDAVGPVLNHIRSGSRWNTIEQNIKTLLKISDSNKKVTLSLAPTVSILNIWFLPDLFQYVQNQNIKVNLNILHGPDYLSIDAIPKQLQAQAQKKVEDIKKYINKSTYDNMMNMLKRDDNEYLFLHAVRHILLLDKIRNENLFDFLPFKDLAIDLTLKNYEYE